MMTSTFTLAFEGPPACIDCTRQGIPSCSHIGFNAEAWDIGGQQVTAPGLDERYTHTVTHVEISADRKTVTITVDTERPPLMDLARHLSTRADPVTKAAVRAVDNDTGEVLGEGRFDAFLVDGQPIYIGGKPYTVASTSHPGRNEHGVVPNGGVDWQEARVVRREEPTITPLSLWPATQ
jgi:hypothetical protein